VSVFATDHLVIYRCGHQRYSYSH